MYVKELFFFWTAGHSGLLLPTVTSCWGFPELNESAYEDRDEKTLNVLVYFIKKKKKSTQWCNRGSSSVAWFPSRYEQMFWKKEKKQVDKLR